MNLSIKTYIANLVFVFAICIPAATHSNDSATQKAISIFSELMKGVKVSQIKPLTGGVSGAGNYMVTSGNQDYVLRVLPDTEPENSVRHEIDITKFMGELGVSPKVFAYSYDKRALIMSAVKGGSIWGYRLTDKDISNLGQKIGKIHSSDFTSNRKPATAWKLVQRAKHELGFPCPEIYQEAVDKHADDFKKLENLSALTHTDLNPGNLLKDDNGIHIIDWNDAGYSNPYLDLASVVIFYIHNPKELKLFLSNYTDGHDNEINKKELNAAYKIYNLLLSLRILKTAKHLGSSMKTPTSTHMKEARDIVKNHKWEKLATILADKEKAYALSRVFLEQSYKDIN